MMCRLWISQGQQHLVRRRIAQRQPQRGVSLVETAVMLPLLLLVGLGALRIKGSDPFKEQTC